MSRGVVTSLMLTEISQNGRRRSFVVCHAVGFLHGQLVTWVVCVCVITWSRGQGVIKERRASLWDLVELSYLMTMVYLLDISRDRLVHLVVQDRKELRYVWQLIIQWFLSHKNVSALGIHFIDVSQSVRTC